MKYCYIGHSLIISIYSNVLFTKLEKITDLKFNGITYLVISVKFDKLRSRDRYYGYFSEYDVGGAN